MGLRGFRVKGYKGVKGVKGVKGAWFRTKPKPQSAKIPKA